MYSALFFLDPSVRMYSKILVFDTASPGIADLPPRTKELLFADLQPLNSSMIEQLVATGSLDIDDEEASSANKSAFLDGKHLMGLDLMYHRCYSPHFNFPDGVQIGEWSDTRY